METSEPQSKIIKSQINIDQLETDDDIIFLRNAVMPKQKDIIFEKMSKTLEYRKIMQANEILKTFPRFFDTPGLVIILLINS